VNKSQVGFLYHVLVQKDLRLLPGEELSATADGHFPTSEPPLAAHLLPREKAFGIFVVGDGL